MRAGTCERAERLCRQSSAGIRPLAICMPETLVLAYARKALFRPTRLSLLASAESPNLLINRFF